MLRVLCVLYASTVFMSCSALCPANKYVTVSAINSRALALTPGRAQLSKHATRMTSTITATASYDATEKAVSFASGGSVPGASQDFDIHSNGFTVVIMAKFTSSSSQTLFDFASDFASETYGARIIMWSPGGSTLRFAISKKIPGGFKWCETQIATLVGNTWLTIVGTWERVNQRLGIKIGNDFVSQSCFPQVDLKSCTVQLGAPANSNEAFKGLMRGFYAVDSQLSTDDIDTIVSSMDADQDTLEECQQCPNGLYSAAGSVAVSDCGCAPGWTLSNSVCAICASGKYKASIGNSPCENCLQGSSSTAGSTICQCNAGYTGADGAICTFCPAGTYKQVTGAAICQSCQPKSTSPVGSNNSNACQCAEGYIDTPPGAQNCQVLPPHELAICSGLQDATAHVLALDANEHSVANLQETRCVRIDPCTQTTGTGSAAGAGEWHHVADLGLPADIVSPAGAHTNLHALEYARVPQGIVLETCPPDFAHYHDTGTWRCNADPATHVRIQGACPSLLPHTILDCLAPTQFDVGSETKGLISL